MRGNPRFPVVQESSPKRNENAFLFPPVTLQFKFLSMAERYLCIACERDERDCECHKYCAICQGENDCRLWQDGQYYCQECREVCDYQPQDR